MVHALADRPVHKATEADIAFILELVQGLHAAGTPAHRLEAAIDSVGRRLGLETQVYSTPTAIFIGFGPPAHQRLVLLRVQPGSIGLERLERLDGIVAQVTRGAATPAEAAAAMRAIAAAPERFGGFSTWLAFVLSSAAAARIFAGGWREVTAAAAIGALVGVLALVGRRRDEVARVVEPAAALGGSLIALAAGLLLGRLSPLIATLAGLIGLLPGLQLTTAVSELATRNLASGTARLAGAAVTFLTLGLGVGLGRELAELLPAVAQARHPAQLPEWTEWLALAVLPLASAVHLRAMPRQLPAMLGAGMLAYFGARLGAHLLGPELGAFVAALLLGAASNAYARIVDRPASVLVVPGIVMLVPGSIGFRSISSLMQNDVLHGMQAAMSMALIAVALAGGLLFANVVVAPRRAV